MSGMARFSVRALDPAALKRARTARGLTQEDLGIRLQVTTHTIGSWEAGKSHPTPGRFVTLAHTLGVKQQDLLTTAATSLADHRQRRELTQGDAAVASGLSIHRVRAIERGVRLPTKPEAVALAKAYRMTAREVRHIVETLHNSRKGTRT